MMITTTENIPGYDVETLDIVFGNIPHSYRIWGNLRVRKMKLAG
jgi:uncharacterized protein YbjQ (UPF0145 family)